MQGIPASIFDHKRNLKNRAIMKCDAECTELVFYYRTT